MGLLNPIFPQNPSYVDSPTASQQMTQISYPDGLTVYSVAWKPDGSQLALTHGAATEIWNWNGSTNTLSLVTTLRADGTPVTVSWSPTGAYLASLELQGPFSCCYELGKIHIWDTASWLINQSSAETYLVNTNYATADRLDWNSDGTLLVGVGNAGQYNLNGNIVSTSDLIAYIINVDTGQRVQSIPLLGPYALSVAWKPLEDIIAVGSQAGADIYDVSTGHYLTWGPPGADVQALDWSSDGRWLLGDSTVMDMSNSTMLGLFHSPAGVTAAAWSPSGDRLVVAGIDGELRVEDPALLPGFEPPTPINDRRMYMGIGDHERSRP